MQNSPCIILRPEQSTGIHGWMNPKRMLTWAMICEEPGITLERCIKNGVTQKQLQSLQPEIGQWIEQKHVSFRDVPYMTEWQPEPLHPIKHLKGNLLDLLENRYPASLLAKLGIDYSSMAQMHMTPDIMRMFKFSLQDWKTLGFSAKIIDYFTDDDITKVFETTREILHMQILAAS